MNDLGFALKDLVVAVVVAGCLIIWAVQSRRRLDRRRERDENFARMIAGRDA